MADMTEIICKCGCRRKKMVRTADVKRGWGLFYSKSCKAKEQERRTGQYREYMERRRRAENISSMNSSEYYSKNTHVFSSEALGQE